MRATAAGALLTLLAASAQAQTLSPELVDRALEARWAEQDLEPAGLADDAAFLRRASLDVRGTLPTPGEVEQFLADDGADKRARSIERLLASPDYARSLSEELTGVLLERLQNQGGEALYRQAFQAKLRTWLAADRPYDALVAELVAGEGPTDSTPQLIYLLDRGPGGAADVAGSVARQFLGLQMECARCHDHPFDDTTQAEFHSLAAFFARMRVRQVPGQQGSFTVTEAPLGEHRFTLADGKRRALAPVAPGGNALTPGVTPKGTTRNSRRVAFARWLTSPENPWFARAIVNRVWSRLFGRGLVEPVDDLAAAADAPLGPLLDSLAKAFVRSGYSLRALHRSLLGSRAYQRGVAHPDAEVARPLFAAAAVRPLPATALADSLLRATDRDRPASGEPRGLHERLRARLVADVLRARPQREGETPDASRVTTAEGVFLLNGRAPNGLVRGPVLTRLLQRHRTPAARVRQLYLRTLSRPPRTAELRRLKAFLKRRGDARAAYEDLFWALLASSEFSTNH